MAFKKELVRKKQTLTYWKITGYNVSVISKRASFFLCGYVDKADRDADEAHPSSLEAINILDADKFDVLFDISEISKLGNNPAKALYEYMKENVADFADAINI